MGEDEIKEKITTSLVNIAVRKKLSDYKDKCTYILRGIRRGLSIEQASEYAEKVQSENRREELRSLEEEITKYKENIPNAFGSSLIPASTNSYISQTTGLYNSILYYCLAYATDEERTKIISEYIDFCRIICANTQNDTYNNFEIINNAIESLISIQQGISNRIIPNKEDKVSKKIGVKPTN